MQGQPHLLAAAAYRSSSDASNAIGAFGSALLNEAKSAITANSSSHTFPSAAFNLLRHK
jgi:hypothetical protein